MSVKTKNIVLIIFVLALAISPLLIKSGAEFGGADGQAEELITQIQPDYEPWSQSIWEPPSGEVESLLFSLQAAIGAGFIGYYLGYVTAKRKTT